MKTNKILCVVLALAMLVSLCACGGASSVSGTITASEAATTEAPAEETEEFSIGATANNSYKNEYFGIGIDLNEEWTFMSQEEINEANGMAKDLLDKEQYAEALDNGTVFTDMSATASDGILTLNATIEKLNALGTLAVDEESYVDISLENTDFKAVFKQMGVDMSVVEKGTITVAEKEHPCIVLEGEVQGIGFYEKVAAIKKGNYVISITASSLVENVVDEIFEGFYAL